MRVDAPSASPAEVDPATAPREADTDERYRRIGQTLRSAQRRAAPVRPDERMLRFDMTEPRPTLQPATQRVRPLTSEPNRPPTPRQRSSQIFAWVIALTGGSLLTAGLGLIGWSLLGPQPELWNWGLFATLGGQGLLAVGLTLLLTKIWTNARQSSSRLVALQSEILRLQRSADALTGDRTATSTRFYADLARGASPELLLANLRGQLEELHSSLATE